MSRKAKSGPVAPSFVVPIRGASSPLSTLSKHSRPTTRRPSKSLNIGFASFVVFIICLIVLSSLFYLTNLDDETMAAFSRNESSGTTTTILPVPMEHRASTNRNHLLFVLPDGTCGMAPLSMDGSVPPYAEVTRVNCPSDSSRSTESYHSIIRFDGQTNMMRKP